MKINSQNQPSLLRIPSLDFIRGIAILGILFINAENFAYPDSWSPWRFGFENKLDVEVRFWVYFLSQGKFYSMLALLFGIGCFLFIENLKNKNHEIDAIKIYSKRLLGLFFIGIFHAYIIWQGDVLYHYAICGILLIPFIFMNTRGLLLACTIMATIITINNLNSTFKRQKSYDQFLNLETISSDNWDEKDIKRNDYWQNKLSRKQSDTATYNPPKPTFISGLKTAFDEIKVHKGIVYHSGILFRSILVMLIGIILYRSGIFSDYKVWPKYWHITLVMLIIGLIVNYLRHFNWTYNYHVPELSLFQTLANTFPKEILGIAYVLILNGLYQQIPKAKALTWISILGRMALSNYIFQNMVLAYIFYGYGLSFHNQFSRTELLFIVVAIWFLQFTITILWFRKYKQGPLEILWRKWTYS